VWESLEHHKALMDSASYAELIEPLKPGLAGQFEMVHVKFNKDPSKALGALVTEVVSIQVKEGKSEADLVELLDQASNIELPGASVFTYGPVIEKPGSYIMAVGWPSIE
ncbi:hypothetical protein NEOLEDRAFT_1031779, partial [Neolentinus lepideus HHB14362 ss-1]